MKLLTLMPKEKHGVWGPYAGDDYNLTLCPLQYMFHGQLYARVDLNPMPKSTLSVSQGLRIWPQQFHITVTTLHRQMQQPAETQTSLPPS
jgi:hypothetical protein